MIYIYTLYSRWFDKSVQFLVYENGYCGVCGEHSAIDATVSRAGLKPVLRSAYLVMWYTGQRLARGRILLFFILLD